MLRIVVLRILILHKTYLQVGVIYNLVCIKMYYMGEYKIKCIKGLILGVRKTFVFILSICLILPSLSYSISSFNKEDLKKFKDLRLTIDEKDDLVLCREIYKRFL